MKYLPLFHNVKNWRCLVVGGGNMALRRSQVLLQAGAVVDVVSTRVDKALEEKITATGGSITLAEFSENHLSGVYQCVVAATDCYEVNGKVAVRAKKQGIPVNVVSNFRDSDFTFPAIVERDALTIAISNSGNSPVLSKLLKQRLEVLIPQAYGELSDFVGRFRETVKSKIATSAERTQFWRYVLQSNIAEKFFSGDRQGAQQLLDQALERTEKVQGEVYLIGAGPGDPELLTLKAFRLIQQAEVVLYDRLVSDEVMALLNPEAEKVYVGKRRADHAVPQEGINQLLVKYAKQGKRVARLKGGDPFIFGRGGEEIETLFEEGVSFQVVPGITAASGCASYAGIPLTHRDHAKSVQFITGQLKDGTVDVPWPELVATDKTLVFYMGLKSLPVICEQLMAHGVSPEMPAAIVEKGTTREQRVLSSKVADIAELIKREDVASPSLFIVGSVVTLQQRLNWFDS